MPQKKARFRKNGFPYKIRVSVVVPRPGKDGALVVCVRVSGTTQCVWEWGKRMSLIDERQKLCMEKSQRL
ncbi:MAG: hypothetical protein LBD04_02640 [Synergistaceae bacterium]|nr:hypothetical protein [Synergistaceae bacterium]